MATRAPRPTRFSRESKATAVDIDQVDLAAAGLRRDQRVTAGRERPIEGNEAHAAAALGDLIDGAIQVSVLVENALRLKPAIPA